MLKMMMMIATAYKQLWSTNELQIVENPIYLNKTCHVMSICKLVIGQKKVVGGRRLLIGQKLSNFLEKYESSMQVFKGVPIKRVDTCRKLFL